MTWILLYLAVLFVAYNNGANDNFKGVATLYGSGVLGYRSALLLATMATFLGSVSAIFLASSLVTSFSGKGLVPDDIAGGVLFLMAVSIGAATTVLIATRAGIPVSTTHALVGALVGAGIAAQGTVQINALGNSFLLPLLISPIIAFSASLGVYWFLHTLRKKLNVTKESCVCVGRQRHYVPVSQLADAASSYAIVGLTVADKSVCQEIYTGQFLGLSLQKILDSGHIVSAAAVSYARGLNDTPKIAGLLVAASAFNVQSSMLMLATAMAAGGLLHSRRLANTISHNISTINHGQGFAANLVTSSLVIFASRYGLPVSTTHVSIGAIFGIGVVSKQRNVVTINSILLAWLLTLPLAACLSAVVYTGLTFAGF